MNKNQLTNIIKQIGRKFPEFKAVKPLISEQIIKPQMEIYHKLSMGAPKQIKKLTRLKFRKKASTRDRTTLERILIVTLNENGKIIKTSMSK